LRCALALPMPARSPLATSNPDVRRLPDGRTMRQDGYKVSKLVEEALRCVTPI